MRCMCVVRLWKVSRMFFVWPVTIMVRSLLDLVRVSSESPMGVFRKSLLLLMRSRVRALVVVVVSVGVFGVSTGIFNVCVFVYSGERWVVVIIIGWLV